MIIATRRINVVKERKIPEFGPVKLGEGMRVAAYNVKNLVADVKPWEKLRFRELGSHIVKVLGEPDFIGLTEVGVCFSTLYLPNTANSSQTHQMTHHLPKLLKNSWQD